MQVIRPEASAGVALRGAEGWGGFTGRTEKSGWLKRGRMRQEHQVLGNRSAHSNTYSLVYSPVGFDEWIQSYAYYPNQDM